MWNPLKSGKSSDFQLDSKDKKIRVFHGVSPKTALTILVAVLTLYLYVLPSIEFPVGGDVSTHYRPNAADLKEYNVDFYDLKDYAPHADGWNHNERVLFLVPLRDASAHLPMFIENLKNITYPHHLIDLAFLVSDTKDTTIKDLKRSLLQIQSGADTELQFGRINIYEKDFGQIIGQSFSDRHGFAAQGPRRKLMAIARNWLLTTALRPDHAWVYWRDADVETIPATIIEDLMHHDKDVIVPNIWRPLPDWLGNEQPYDLNSWQESEAGLDLADQLDEDAVIVEGYSEYKTWRVHLGYVRDPFGDPEVEMDLDGIGGVSILSKGNVFRSGAMFPAFSYLKHAETEGFGKLCKTMGYRVIGLPHYVIWHIYEPSVQDLQHMKWMAEEKKNRVQKAKNKRMYDKKWTEAFVEVGKEWEILKFNVFKNTDLRRYIQLEWNDVDGYLKLYEEPERNIFPELDTIEADYSLNEMSQRYKNGYIPPNEIFNSFPLNNAASRDKFKFVRFDEPEREAENFDDVLNVDNKLNSNKNEKQRKEQEREEKEQIQKETQSELEESRREVEAEVKKVEDEHNQEMQKVKEMEMTPEQLEEELERLQEMYERKKKEREERKLIEEAERLSNLAEKKKRKKLLKEKAIQAEKDLRRKMAIEKEMERRQEMFQKQLEAY